MNELTFEEQAIIQMKRKKITYSSLANKLNISIVYVSDIIKGNRQGGKYRDSIKKILDIKE